MNGGHTVKAIFKAFQVSVQMPTDFWIPHALKIPKMYSFANLQKNATKSHRERDLFSKIGYQYPNFELFFITFPTGVEFQTFIT